MRRFQVLILHLWAGNEIRRAEKNKECSTNNLLRWPVLQIHEPLDTTAAALDARCLQTSSNSGDRAAWCVCNDASNKHLDKVTRLTLSSDPQNKRTNHAQFERCEPRNARTTRHTRASETHSEEVFLFLLPLLLLPRDFAGVRSVDG